ncbi:MAG TPA: VOC family protein [Acidimicrobiia bacterium]|nr:VOC family protein [Acidimicrobiia bacterium]
MTLTGIDHLGLTVADLDRATRWYCETLGFERSLGYRNAAIGADVEILVHPDLGDLRVSLRRYDDTARDPFSEFATGLDHVAFGVADGDQLARWQTRLEAAGVPSTRTDLVELSILAFRDPDNIQLELCTPIQERPGGSSIDESGRLAP